MKLINIYLYLYFYFYTIIIRKSNGFNAWKDNFKKIALKNNISEKTFDIVMANIKFLPM